MVAQLEFFLLGLATVIDTVLLLATLEPVNRSQVSVWLKALVGGLWLWHTSSFLHTALLDAVGPVSRIFDVFCMIGMTSGLLILPSAMLHSALRLNHTGLIPHPPRRLWYGLLYLPMFALPAAGWLIWNSTELDFVSSVEPLKHGYLVWLVLANLISAAAFLRLRKRLRVPGANSFFLQLSIVLVLQTIFAATYAILTHDSRFAASLRIATNLLPLVPALLFTWYVLRQRMLPLVIERTLAYGAALAIGLLLHRMTISRYSEKLGDRFHLDTVLLEALIVLGLIMVFRPLRQRLRESLRHLFGRNILSVRESTRRLSLQIAQESHQAPSQLLDWFVTVVPHELQLDWIRIVLHAGIDAGSNANPAGSAPAVDVRTPCNADPPSLEDNGHHDLRQIHEIMKNTGATRVSRGDSSGQDLQLRLIRLEALHAFTLHFHAVDGLLLLGPRTRNDTFSDEQLAALSLLFDQFAATLHNRIQELARVRAERKAMQQEKLSVLGLLAGSLAHELRNPLSSMRTIASLLAEDLGPTDDRTTDVRMIISEIDRLNQTTQRLLEFSRPSDDQILTVAPDVVLQRLAGILAHLARQWHVTLDVELDAALARISASDASFSEICFNLIRNAIEAVRDSPSPRVHVSSRLVDSQFVVTISDNGPGIDPALREAIFQPFVTGKSDGTGLGLYIVSERVAELNGRIQCHSENDRGTMFEVSLPVAI